MITSGSEVLITRPGNVVRISDNLIRPISGSLAGRFAETATIGIQGGRVAVLWDGSSPTPDTGQILEDGTIFTLTDTLQIINFRAVGLDGEVDIVVQLGH
jgi:hypothetical protein